MPLRPFGNGIIAGEWRGNRTHPHRVSLAIMLVAIANRSRDSPEVVVSAFSYRLYAYQPIVATANGVAGAVGAIL